MAKQWKPQFCHVSQLHTDGSGWDDCWEASLARYLYENGTFADDVPIEQALDDVSVASGRGPDTPSNPDTTIGQCEQSLRAYDLPVTWTTSYDEAHEAGWSIVYCDGRALRPAQYPADWLPPGPQHFILWLPFYQDADDWFNDPLAYDNGQADCQYELGAVQAAFAGAFILPDIAPKKQAKATPELPAEPATVYHIRNNCALKHDPDHSPEVVGWLAAGTVVLPTGRETPHWEQVIADGLRGYVLKDNVREEGD